MKGCLIGALVLLFCVLLAGVGVVRLYQNVSQDMPDYAHKEVVMSQYGTLISRVEAIVAESESLYDLAAKLEKMKKPDELVYLILEKESGLLDKEVLEIVKEKEFSSRWRSLLNGFGHGELDDTPVVVVSIPVRQHGVEECVLYLVHHDRRKP